MSRTIGKVGIFGTGKVALSLGYHLANRGYELGYCGRSLSKAQRYVEEIGALTFVSAEALLDWCDVIGFVVTDRAISEVSASLSEIPSTKEKYAFHMSGALAADEIKGDYSEKFSLHPLRAFAKVEPDLSDTTFALEIYKGHCSPEIDEFANEFGRVVKVASEHKTLYHASAVIASNFIIPLIHAANTVLRQIEIGDEDLLWPLIDSAIANMKNLGVSNALTGPIARGDVSTVEKHLKALSRYAGDINKGPHIAIGEVEVSSSSSSVRMSSSSVRMSSSSREDEEEETSFLERVSEMKDILEMYTVLSRYALRLSDISESEKREIIRIFETIPLLHEKGGGQ